MATPMPLSLSAVRAVPQSPVSVSCSQIEAGLFASSAARTAAGPSTIAAAARSASARQSLPWFPPRMIVLLDTMGSFRSRPAPQGLFGELGELPDRGKMRLADRWVEKRPRLGALEVGRYRGHVLPVIGIGLRSGRIIIDGRRHGHPSERQHGAAHRVARAQPFRKTSFDAGIVAVGKILAELVLFEGYGDHREYDDLPVVLGDCGVEHAHEGGDFVERALHGIAHDGLRGIADGLEIGDE